MIVYMPLSTDEFLRIAKALADRRRLAILERIAARGNAACQHLCEEFPVSQPTMSHHLRLLAEVGLIEMRREGQGPGSAHIDVYQSNRYLSICCWRGRSCIATGLGQLLVVRS